MNAKANAKRFGALGVVAVIAAIAIPAAGAGSASDPGLVARKLGSPDPHENATKRQYAPGIVASRLGSPDPQETGLSSVASGQVASRLGSPDPRDTAVVEPLNGQAPAAIEQVGHLTISTHDGQNASRSSAVARTLGSQDPRDTALVGQSVPVSTGFDWGDFGIGLGFGIGLCAILAGTFILASVAFRGRTVAQPLA